MNNRLKYSAIVPEVSFGLLHHFKAASVKRENGKMMDKLFLISRFLYILPFPFVYFLCSSSVKYKPRLVGITLILI